jgi:hypothetical protein
MRKPDWSVVASYSDANSIEFRDLQPAQAARLTEIGFPNLRALSLRHLRATDLQVLVHFPQLKRLAARFPCWSKYKPWLCRFDQDMKGCAKCGTKRTFLFLERKKRIWCSECDADRLGKVLSEFDSLIQHFRATG